MHVDKEDGVCNFLRRVKDMEAALLATMFGALYAANHNSPRNYEPHPDTVALVTTGHHQEKPQDTLHINVHGLRDYSSQSGLNPHPDDVIKVDAVRQSQKTHPGVALAMKAAC